jgi:hypothetical protein
MEKKGRGDRIRGSVAGARVGQTQTEAEKEACAFLEDQRKSTETHRTCPKASLAAMLYGRWRSLRFVLFLYTPMHISSTIASEAYIEIPKVPNLAPQLLSM